MQWKQNLSETEQSVMIWTITILMLLQKLLNKLVDVRNLSINLLPKESTQKHSSVKKWHLISWAQSFCFLQQDHIDFLPSLPKGLTWHFIETKAIKHDYYSILIMRIHKNIKGKYWVVSQQALFFNAFLAQHHDFNDARIKDKNWSIKRASWRIWLAYLNISHFLCLGILWTHNL